MNKAFIIVILIMATGAFGFFFVWPKYQTLKVDLASEAAKGADLQARKSYYSDLADLDAKLQQYSLQLSIIDKALPSEVLDPLVFDFFQKEVSQTKMVLKSIGSASVAASNKHPGLKEYSLNFSVAGSYDVFKNFLSFLEKSGRIIKVEQISFASPAGKELPISANLSVKFYSY